MLPSDRIGAVPATRLRFESLRHIAVACVAWIACGDPPDTVAEQALADLDPPKAERVVSLSPLASRFVVAIGAADRLVGVDAMSARRAELEGLPVVDASGAASLGPDLVLVSEGAALDAPLQQALQAQGAELVEFAPHDLQDVSDLCRRVGARLVGAANALRFETDFGRPLAEIGGASSGMPRPRVLAVVGFGPLQLAGGHSFETDLIEIAGGSSVTHAGSEPRLEAGADQIAAYAPDLILAVRARAWTPAEQSAARAQLPHAARIEFFAFAPDFWLDEPVGVAKRLRAVIEPLARELAAQAPPS
jgi:ABC-type hemin transport system substrate-binding protein